MISIESDPVDYLPYVDGSITDAERNAVEQLIRDETPADLRVPHPQLGELAPLSENRPLLMRDIEKFENDDHSGTVPDTFLSEGISMDRYTDFGDDEHTYNRMYTALSYSILRDRNAQICVENAAERAHAQALATERLKEIDAAQRELISRKRRQVEDLTSTREAKQTQFQPVNGYLEQRWKDGIKNMVDIGIDRSGCHSG